MPITNFCLAVRGWGPNPAESYEKAAERLLECANKIRNGEVPTDHGVAFRYEDPGNGGPCGPIDTPRVQNFEYLMATNDLPEYQAAMKERNK